MAVAEVTVAVVVKDRREDMASCLEALYAQSLSPGEIVVVDNGSTDGTWELLRRAEAGGFIRLFRDRGSLGTIRNRALAAARFPIIAFTDSDCRPRTDWLRNLIAPFEDPDVSIVQGRTLPAGDDGDPFPMTQRIERLSGLYEACNVAYRSNTLRAAGGFDERIGQFGEDTAAAWSVLERGGRPAFAATAVVEHTVTYPGMRMTLRRAWAYQAWPQLVHDHPGLRRALLWNRVFLKRRTAAFDAAVVAVAVATVGRRRSAVVLAAPYIVMSTSPRLDASARANDARRIMLDVVTCAALLVGSVKAKTVVL